MPSSVNTNPDLIKERKKCTFDPLELTHLLDGGVEKTLARKEREQYFLEDPELKTTVPISYLSHKEKYEESIKKACILFTKVQDLQRQGKGGMDNFKEILGGQIGSAILKDGNPLTLHYVMFIPTLLGQADPDQINQWINKAWNCEIIGTYAQTELGHGTFIRGLETTATYDTKTEEFILNSPTLTSFKWWPGGLAQTANYAVVVAQLYTQGQCHGIHPFIVQLRDEETHEPLAGIKIGEIGTKLGMNATNNGYLGFTNVRIPRNHMLMKNNKVLKDGTYVKSPSSKLTYGTMMFVRVVIVQDMGTYLRKAVTIAIRYSAVRHQSELKPNAPEPQILDYVTQQYKLFPLLAACFAFHYSADWIWNMYNNVTEDIDKGQLGNLPELHAIACCLKAVSTSDSALAVETCRLACGGHGYMTSSNLPGTYGLVTAACTYEGENTVLFLQTARYLIKVWQQCVNGQPLTPTVQYLNEYSKDTKLSLSKSVVDIIKALQQIAASKIELAARHINERAAKGLAPENAWNQTSIELVGAAEAHCRAFVVKTYYEKMLNVNVSAQLRTILNQLCELYAVNTLLKSSGDFLRFTSGCGKDLEMLQIWLENLLALIRPNAVGIVDGFDIHDDVLASALGSYDGRVYERLFEEASKSPLNAEPVNKSFHLHLKPFLKGNL